MGGVLVVGAGYWLIRTRTRRPWRKDRELAGPPAGAPPGQRGPVVAVDPVEDLPVR
jgi:hypothetical protein